MKFRIAALVFVVILVGLLSGDKPGRYHCDCGEICARMTSVERCKLDRCTGNLTSSTLSLRVSFIHPLFEHHPKKGEICNSSTRVLKFTRKGPDASVRPLHQRMVAGIGLELLNDLRPRGDEVGSKEDVSPTGS